MADRSIKEKLQEEWHIENNENQKLLKKGWFPGWLSSVTILIMCEMYREPLVRQPQIKIGWFFSFQDRRTPKERQPPKLKRRNYNANRSLFSQDANLISFQNNGDSCILLQIASQLYILHCCWMCLTSRMS
jgi:hypothetical protein